jgi:hypothetical protein
MTISAGRNSSGGPRRKDTQMAGLFLSIPSEPERGRAREGANWLTRRRGGTPTGGWIGIWERVEGSRSRHRKPPKCLIIHTTPSQEAIESRRSRRRRTEDPPVMGIKGSFFSLKLPPPPSSLFIFRIQKDNFPLWPTLTDCLEHLKSLLSSLGPVTPVSPCRPSISRRDLYCGLHYL